MKKRNYRRKNSRIRPLFAVTFVVLLAVVWAECSVSRILFSYGEHAASNQAQRVFAEVVGELCKTQDLSAAISAETDDAGRVKAFSGNTTLQNAIQAQLATALCEAFDQTDRASFSVPLGSLFGDAFSSGRGPSVTFYTALATSPTVTLSDSFSAAGINQTYHTVTAEARFDVLITALGKTERVTLALSAPVSQTTIVGDVPQFYAAF